MIDAIKHIPDAENEIHDLAAFKDFGYCVLTPIVRFDAAVALGLVTTLAGVVRTGHATQAAHVRDGEGIVRAQTFEEGAVYMVAPPFDGFAADRYLMDFYDVTDRDLCSRMHMHTGMRFVRMMTGPETSIRVSGLSEFRFGRATSSFELETFEDQLTDPASGRAYRRYNAVVPERSWVDMQIPRGTAHQFNAIGPHAVIDTVHPEESIEIFRERASRINMMAQTVFLEAEPSTSEACRDLTA
ncbi:MAG: hypothetical protein HOV77_11435 [Hamadaea sp.]|uniref:hypothetical protein n=1 Tax=Hamadaea sp. TaxID=2024425 RepID=UPI0018018A54|nr:hypothetical protein [Hamadaea sp.]NUT19792.1 hypothetical protein [Hamadaea sp.]